MCIWSPEEDVRAPGTEIICAGSHSCSETLNDQQVLLSAKPSLQSSECMIFYCVLVPGRQHSKMASTLAKVLLEHRKFSCSCMIYGLFMWVHRAGESLQSELSVPYRVFANPWLKPCVPGLLGSRVFFSLWSGPMNTIRLLFLWVGLHHRKSSKRAIFLLALNKWGVF